MQKMFKTHNINQFICKKKNVENLNDNLGFKVSIQKIFKPLPSLSMDSSPARSSTLSGKPFLSKFSSQENQTSNSVATNL